MLKLAATALLLLLAQAEPYQHPPESERKEGVPQGKVRAHPHLKVGASILG